MVTYFTHLNKFSDPEHNLLFKICTHRDSDGCKKNSEQGHKGNDDSHQFRVVKANFW